MPELTLVLPRPWISRNNWQRMHFGAAGAHTKRARQQIAGIVALHGFTGCFRHVQLEATRYCTGELDLDSLTGGLKYLIDCLVVRTARNPHGLGLILDDRASILDRLDVDQVRLVKAAEGQARTVLVLRGSQVASGGL